MTTDYNKDLEDSYNFLNLPKTVTNTSTHQVIHYQYTATREKLSQKLYSIQGRGTRRDYAGPFVYVNNQLAWINLPRGRWVYTGKELKAELHLHDHLGNVRMVLEESDNSLVSVQQASYYPFGKAIHELSSSLPDPESTLDNRYLYNRKLERSGNPDSSGEFQADFGLDWYDYGARFYDAETSRCANCLAKRILIIAMHLAVVFILP